MIPLDPTYLIPRLLGRENESHKGNYGHLLLVCGCQRMPGAAVLATGAALQSGCGLVTLHSTSRTLQAVVNHYPSAMLSEDPGDCLSTVPVSLDRYKCIAIGPGLGQSSQTEEALHQLLCTAGSLAIPLVLDADALNMLAVHPWWMADIPAGSIMTPHLGELRRLSPLNDSPEDAAKRLAREFACHVVLKGFHSKIFSPDGTVLVNSTGNPGMAKGGSGDVLTGLIGGLIARGYPSRDAAALGVWLHGYAGDRLTEERTAESYSSRDLIDALWKGFKELYTFEGHYLSL